MSTTQDDEPPVEPPTLQAVVDALQWFDDTYREDRARRLIWAGQFNKNYGIVMGRPETLSLLEEARVCFVNGNFIAALITAVAFIEQSLAEELELSTRAHPGFMGFGKLIEAVRTRQLLPDALLDDIDRLRLLRNPHAHNVGPGPQQQHRLPIRSRDRDLHPEVILEEDARLAIRTMYECRDKTMHPWDPRAELTARQQAQQ